MDQEMTISLRRDVEVKVSSAYRWIEVKASSASDMDRASKDIYFLQMEAGGGDVCVKDQKFLFLLNLVPDFSYLPYVLPEFTDLNHLRHIAGPGKNKMREGQNSIFDSLGILPDLA
ncbi:hypothetical protein D5086_022983 [Populus alba]|uniref:Uncharacterized protein n=1 Tax=Populus alba TaxID=43335 RepID=A0ACC4BA00_POPAL